jgi:hypothetical protein
MIKPYHLLISILVGLGIGYLVNSCTGKQSASIKQEKEELKKDEAKVIKLAPKDSFWMRRARIWEDSAKYHKKAADFWMRKYKSPISVTKDEIMAVFREDSTTITKEVKRGVICDSLQRSQGTLIKSLSQANEALDSAIRVKNETIKYSLKMDSTYKIIEMKLTRKVVNRTIGEIALGLLALLVIVFHG